MLFWVQLWFRIYTLYELLAYYVNRLLGYYLNIMRTKYSRIAFKVRAKSLTAPNCSYATELSCNGLSATIVNGSTQQPRNCADKVKQLTSDKSTESQAHTGHTSVSFDFQQDIFKVYNLIQGVPENCLGSNVLTIILKPFICWKCFTPLFFLHIITVKLKGEPPF